MFFGVNCSEDTKKCEKQSPIVERNEGKKEKKIIEFARKELGTSFYILKKKWKKQRRSDAYEQNLANPINMKTCILSFVI